MRKLKTFFYVFKNSAFKPNYYQAVLKAPFKFSLKYFLFLFFTLGFLTALTLSLFLVQKGTPVINQLKNQVPQFYPADLEIKIKNGQITTNVPEPYFLPLKPDWFPEDIRQGLKNQPLQNILVIDTSVEPSEIRKYQTFALLTKKDIAFLADRQEIRIQSLEEIEDFTLNQAGVNQAWQKIIPFFRWLLPLILFSLLLFLPTFIIAGKFIYLVFFSFLSLIISRLFKLKLGYQKAFQVNLHAITLPTIILALFQFLGVNPQIPFFQSIILLIFNLIIFSSLAPKNN